MCRLFGRGLLQLLHWHVIEDVVGSVQADKGIWQCRALTHQAIPLKIVSSECMVVPASPQTETALPLKKEHLASDLSPHNKPANLSRLCWPPITAK